MTVLVVSHEPEAPLQLLGDAVPAEAAGPARALERLGRTAHGVDALVFATDLAEPLELAQRAHFLDRDVAIAILCERASRDRVALALEFAPFLGEDVVAVADDDTGLAEAVAAAAERTARRRELRPSRDQAEAQTPPAEQFLGHLLEHAPIGVAVVDASGALVGWNRSAGEIFGTSESEAVGLPFSRLFPGDIERVARLVARAAAADGDSAVETFERASADGRQFVEVTAAPLTGRAGERGVTILMRDVTAAALAEDERRALEEARARDLANARLAEERLRFLAEASALLAESLDYEVTLARVARLAIPTLADWCIVDELREDGTIERVAVAAASPRKREVLEELRASYPPSWDSPQPAARALRSGEPVVYDEFPEDVLRATVIDDRHFELLSALAPSASVAIPLVAHGQTLGAVTFAFAESGRRYDEPDLALAGVIARRAALAVDRARLYRQEQRARVAAEAAQDRVVFLAEATEILAASLDYEATLQSLATLAVERLADWCIVYTLEGEGGIRRLALAHADVSKRDEVARELADFSLNEDATTGVPQVIRSGQPAFHPEATPELLAADVDDPSRFVALMRRLEITSWMCVPLASRGRTLGAISFVFAESGGRYDEDDLTLAGELARRAGTAIDNARLYREVEARAQAARALATVGDGVVLLDARGVVRLWNPAAEGITGLRASEVVGRPADEAVPGWAGIVHLIPIAEAGRPAATRAQTLPLDVRGREIWLSLSGVGFGEGTVFTFRDVTEERRLEQLKTEFVATASHELRTPLAAVYGAAMTLRRRDIELSEEARARLISVIADESDRLARIVQDILWASKLDAGEVTVEISPLDARESARRVVEAAKAHLAAGLELALVAPDRLPPVAADEQKLSQVLANLVDNAVKYSPEGGRVELRLEEHDHRLRFAVRDEGLGIPAHERERIFEKFYRLDPNLTRGVGGTGLGLYICRELVRRMNGRIWVTSSEGDGSTFFVELPLAEPRSSTRVDIGSATG